MRALRERGLKVVDLSADFRLDQAAYERWYQPHEAPELLDEAVYGLPEAHRDEIRGAELVAGPGCNSTAALLALLPLARTHRGGRGGHQDRRVGRRARGHRGDPLRVGGRQRERLQDRGPPPRGRARAGAARACTSPSSATCCRSTRGSSPAATRTPARAARRATRCASCSRRAYADEPFVELVDAPPRTRDVRDTNRAPRARDRGERARAGVLRDRQPLEGRRRPGRAGPQPDARAARDARGSSERLLPLALGRAPRARARARAAPRCRRASAPPGVAAGIKPDGLDVGVLVSDAARHGLRRALHHQRARGRAGDRSRARPTSAGLRAVVANSGCSNVGDGQRGLDTAAGDAGGRGRELGVEPRPRSAWPRPA